MPSVEAYPWIPTCVGGHQYNQDHDLDQRRFPRITYRPREKDT